MNTAYLSGLGRWVTVPRNPEKSERIRSETTAISHHDRRIFDKFKLTSWHTKKVFEQVTRELLIPEHIDTNDILRPCGKTDGLVGIA